LPPLKNLKHERFCHEVTKQPSYSKAYAEVYKEDNPQALKANASRLIANDSVRNRVAEILNLKGLDLGSLSSRLNRWANDEEHPSVSLDAVKTGFKLHGALDSDEKSGSNMQNIQIIIGTLAEDSNV